MRITKVWLENWGPYKGVQEIDIQVSENSPVVVIWGENGNGKTKFIDALKWVFSGGDFGYIKVGPYISMDAIRDGDVFDTGVSVEFEQNGVEYKVSRGLRVDPAQLEDPDDPALADRLLKMPDKTKVTLEKIGEAAYTQEQARLVLLRLFPARLVNFYFFDAAELIESFKDLSGVNGAYHSTLDIQNSVETAMGFKGYESYIETLRDLESELATKAEKEVTDRGKLEKFKSEKERLIALRSQKTADKEESQKRLRQNQERLADQRQILEGMGEYLDQQRERNSLEAGIALNKSRVKNLRSEISIIFSGLWLAPFGNSLVKKNDEIQSIKSQVRDWEASVASQQARITRLEEDTLGTKCPSCGQDLDKGHRETMSRNLELARKELDDLNECAPVGVDSLRGRDLDVYANAWQLKDKNSLKLMIDKTDEIAALQVDIADSIQRVASIRSQLGSVDDVDFVAVFDEIQELEQTGRDLEANIKDCSDDILDFDAKISSVDKQISNLSSVGGAQSRTRLIKVQKLRTELAFVLQELKNKVRNEIQRESNVILQSLVLEQDKQYSIAVGHDYVLSTDKFNPNAGFKQQVILAFLFAIPRVAKAHFPVVIDSPLQHMGLTNRSNFLKWCASGLNQVVLLPHDAELTKEDVHHVFGESLSRFYELALGNDGKTTSVIRKN